MNSITLSSLESAALMWLADSAFAQDPQPVRLVEGQLCIEYWHAAHQCYGMLIVVDTLTTPDVLKLITAAERQVAARQHRDVETMIREGTPKGEAHDTAYGYPTRIAICVPFDEINDSGYETYQRASGTFDEPLVIAMWDGATWSFQEEEIV